MTERTSARDTVEFASQNMDLRIDELVLHGFRPGDQHAIAAAIERELARLFAEEGMPPGLAIGSSPMEAQDNGVSDVFRVNAGSVELPHDAPPNVVGARVAKAIHRGLGGGVPGAVERGRATS